MLYAIPGDSGPVNCNLCTSKLFDWTNLALFPFTRRVCESSGLHDKSVVFNLSGPTKDTTHLNTGCDSVLTGALGFTFVEEKESEYVGFLKVAHQHCLINGICVEDREVELKSPSLILIGNHGFVYIGAASYSIDAHKYYCQSEYGSCQNTSQLDNGYDKCGRFCVPGESKCQSRQPCRFGFSTKSTLGPTQCGDSGRSVSPDQPLMQPTTSEVSHHISNVQEGNNCTCKSCERACTYNY